MRDEIGLNLMRGISDGIEMGVPETIREVILFPHMRNKN